jgi:hypothetical protein
MAYKDYFYARVRQKHCKSYTFTYPYVKVKEKLSLCLKNEAPCYEGVCGVKAQLHHS